MWGFLRPNSMWAVCYMFAMCLGRVCYESVRRLYGNTPQPFANRKTWLSTGGSVNCEQRFFPEHSKVDERPIFTILQCKKVRLEKCEFSGGFESWLRMIVIISGNFSIIVLWIDTYSGSNRFSVFVQNTLQLGYREKGRSILTPKLFEKEVYITCRNIEKGRNQ